MDEIVGTIFFVVITDVALTFYEQIFFSTINLDHFKGKNNNIINFMSYLLAHLMASTRTEID